MVMAAALKAETILASTMRSYSRACSDSGLENQWKIFYKFSKTCKDEVHEVHLFPARSSTSGKPALQNQKPAVTVAMAAPAVSSRKGPMPRIVSDPGAYFPQVQENWVISEYLPSNWSGSDQHSIWQKNMLRSVRLCSIRSQTYHCCSTRARREWSSAGTAAYFALICCSKYYIS